MPLGRRIPLTVYVNLDPVPGTFNTEDNARETVQRILDESIPHYFPGVSLYTPSRHVTPTFNQEFKNELFADRDEPWNRIKHALPLKQQNPKTDLIPLGDWKMTDGGPRYVPNEENEKPEKPETD